MKLKIILNKMDLGSKIMNVKMEADDFLFTSSQEEELMGELKVNSEDIIMDSFLNHNLLDLNGFVSNEDENNICLNSYITAPDEMQLQNFNVGLRPPQLPIKATCNLPSTEDYPGDLGFSLELLGVNSTGKTWIYSSSLKKIFINMNKILPIRFQWKQEMADIQLHVRSLLVYTCAQYLQDPVERCHHHGSTLDKSNRNFSFPDHIIRSEHPAAVYHHDAGSGRRSVVIPLDRPQPGDDTVTGMYSFHCKNSCPSGMNRRATQIIFTLEDDEGTVRGRQTLSIRICSCPKRDMQKEEEDECGKANPIRKRPINACATVTSNKKTKYDSGLHTVQLQVRGVETLRGVLTYCLGAVSSKAKQENREMDDQEKALEQQYLEMLNGISP